MTTKGDIDEILETLDGVPFLYTIDRHPKYQEVKAKLEAHQKRMVLEAELKGMKVVNNCHGCVDNDEYLDERRRELIKELAELKESLEG